MSREECRACVLERRHKRRDKEPRPPSRVRRNSYDYCEGLYEIDLRFLGNGNRLRSRPKYLHCDAEEYFDRFGERKRRKSEASSVKHSRPSAESTDFDEYYEPFRFEQSKYDYPGRIFTVMAARPRQDNNCVCSNCRCTRNCKYQPRYYKSSGRRDSSSITYCPHCVPDGGIVDNYRHYFPSEEQKTEYCRGCSNRLGNERETGTFCSTFVEKITSLFGKRQKDARQYVTRTVNSNRDSLVAKIHGLEEDLGRMKEKLATECVRGIERANYAQLKAHLAGLNEQAERLKEELMAEYSQRVRNGEMALNEARRGLISRAASIQDQVRVLQERVKRLGRHDT